MNCTEIVFSGHAVQRMYERSLTEADVVHVIGQGVIVEAYPHDMPYPSNLLLAFVRTIPVHAVVARVDTTGRCIVVTVYVPDPARWSSDFKTRRRP